MAETSGDSGERLTTLADVYNLFNTFLGRPPKSDADAIGYGRVGLPYEQVKQEIYNSQEAQNLRAKILGPIGPTGPTGPIKGAEDDIKTQIWNGLLGSLSGLGEIKDDITAQIAVKLNEALPAIGTALAGITKQLDEFTKGLIPSTLSLVGAALGGVETLLSTMLANSADIGDIADLFVSTVSGQKGNIGEFLFALIAGDEDNIASAIGGKIVGALIPDTDDVKVAVDFARMTSVALRGGVS